MFACKATEEMPPLTLAIWFWSLWCYCHQLFPSWFKSFGFLMKLGTWVWMCFLRWIRATAEAVPQCFTDSTFVSSFCYTIESYSLYGSVQFQDPGQWYHWGAVCFSSCVLAVLVSLCSLQFCTSLSTCFFILCHQFVKHILSSLPVLQFPRCPSHLGSIYRVSKNHFQSISPKLMKTRNMTGYKT